MLETVNSPEDNESTFLSTDSRKTQRKKRELSDGHRKGVHKHRSKRIDFQVQDPDIQKEIKKGLDVKILYDSTR